MIDVGAIAKVIIGFIALGKPPLNEER